MLALTNCTLYTGADILHHHALILDGAHILAIRPTATLASDCPRVDLQQRLVSPGFIDLQLNGCGGVMFNDAITAATLEAMHRANLRSGTTSFLPTLITTSDEDMQAAIELLPAYQAQYPHRVLGLHLEGPYLNPARKGIHDGTYVRSPDDAMVKAIAAAGPDTVRLLTLAPEHVSEQTVHTLVSAGICVAAGHTNATYQQALRGFHWGITMVTHLFNAMSPWQSRQPGMVGAALEKESIYAGIIADGHHVHFTSIALAKRLKQEKLFLVTDATPPAGSSLASFMIGGQEVFYRDGKCVSADGTLGGSALTMIEAIANCVRYAGIALAEALRMATLYPARAIQVDHKLGRLAPGYLANLAILDDQLRVVEVVEQGKTESLLQTLAEESHGS